MAFAVPLLMIHTTLRKTLWFLGALSVFAALVPGSIFSGSSGMTLPPRNGNSTLSGQSGEEPINSPADFTAHRSPERFIFRGLSPNSRHIDWHMFSEVSMRQYIRDEIRERLQMIGITAEARTAAPPHLVPETLHLAAGARRRCNCWAAFCSATPDPNLQIILPPDPSLHPGGQQGIHLKLIPASPEWTIPGPCRCTTGFPALTC